MAGNSCLREALARAVTDEIGHELNLHSASSMVDIERFYDTLTYDGVCRAAWKHQFPARVLAMTL